MLSQGEKMIYIILSHNYISSGTNENWLKFGGFNTFITYLLGVKAVSFIALKHLVSWN